MTTRRPFGLAFAPAPPATGLASPPRSTRRLILQKARRHPSRGLRPARSARFQVSFTPLTGVLFTVPSRYWSTIGRRRYLALGCGHPSFRPDITCPAVLTYPFHPGATPTPTGLSPPPVRRSSAVRSSVASFQARSLPPPPNRPYNPDMASPAGCAATPVSAPPRSLAAT
jgi:hypothetical protein